MCMHVFHCVSNMFLESGWAMIWGLKYLLRSCFDPIYIYVVTHCCYSGHQVHTHELIGIDWEQMQE